MQVPTRGRPAWSRAAFDLVAILLVITTPATAADQLADLMATTRSVGEVPAFANEYVHVRYAMLEFPPASPREAAERPVALYVQLVVDTRSGVQRCTRLLGPTRGARPSWRPGVVPRGVHIEVLDWPPAPPALGEPGTSPPADAVVDENACGAPTVLAAFRPFDYGVGTGPYPSVTVFLSDGVVEVWSRGVRRRMGVQAGDAFWFEGATRITAVDDMPVGAVIVQLASR